MKNPFKPEPSAQDRDNPVVRNVTERPVERASDRAMHDNPLVPNVIERPVEQAVAGDHAAAVDRPGRADRSGNHESPGDRGATRTNPADIARGRAAERASVVADDTRHADLFPNEELVGYRTQWESIQTGFVDRPRDAVAQADALVSQVVTRLTEVFTRERSMLEGQWTKGDNVSTEDLRLALTRYRSFFQRLLSI
jgi:hypothetical protein